MLGKGSAIKKYVAKSIKGALPTLTQGLQQEWLRLFVQYLYTVGLIFSKSEDVNVMKLLCDSFVMDQFWQELADIVLLQAFNNYGAQESQLGLRSSFSVEAEEQLSDKAIDLIKIMEYYISLCHLLVKAEQKSREEARHYWSKPIQRALKSIGHFFAPSEGILSKCLVQGGASYSVVKEILKLVAHFFLFSPRLNKYFNAEWTLFYIRTHYIAFIRLYNKGISSHDDIEKKTSIELCKAHIKCLLAMARNRNEETSRNFYRMRCAEFLTREIDFEYTSEVIGKSQHGKKGEAITQFTPSFTSKADKKFGQALEEKKDDAKCSAGKSLVNPIVGIMRGKKLEESSVKPFELTIKDDSSIIKIEPPEKKEESAYLDAKSPENAMEAQVSSAESRQSAKRKGESRVARADSGRGDVSKVIKKNLLVGIKDKASAHRGSFEPAAKSQPKSRLQPNPRAIRPKVLVDLHRPAAVSVISAFDKSLAEAKEEVKSTFKPPEPRPGEEGTFVGSNKVWVPLLKFPQNIDNYKEGGRVVMQVERPDEDRFKLKRSTKGDLNKSSLQPSMEKSMEVTRSMKKGLLDLTCVGGSKGKLAPPKGFICVITIVKQKEVKKEQYKNPPANLLESKGQSEEKRLSAIEEALSANKNKWQLIKEVPKKTLNPFEQYTEVDIAKERMCRAIYKDDELHALIIGLLFALLLKPPRGVLDDLYCSANPLDEGKTNVLYLLHFHLNHPLNQEVLPLVFEVVRQLRPPLAGQRLLKLLCKHFFDISMYTGWSKIATGAFGTVFECSTSLPTPQLVAVKQLPFPNSISGRCVLYDIFSEVAALQELRGENCAVPLHDYGVDDSSYYLVMKRYDCSLREWRAKQIKGLAENLPVYMKIFREVLKAVVVTHQHSITHYDLKCDNFLLEDNCVALGDYGECKLFNNEEDECDWKARGTECIKSPEMLTLSVELKDGEKSGTTRKSDVWSLGCLLYELLTGEYLFSNEDYVVFYLRVTSEEEKVLAEDKAKGLEGNVYLLNFLSYLLVRDARKRPSIEQVVDRFRHVEALLTSNEANIKISAGKTKESEIKEMGLEDLLLRSVSMMEKKRDIKIIERKAKAIPSLITLMKNMHLCSAEYLYKHKTHLIASWHVTHIVIPTHLYKDEIASCFSVLKLETCQCSTNNAYSLAPTVLDYLRSVALHNGIVLFIDDSLTSCVQCRSEAEGTIREAALLALGHTLDTTGYEAWTLCRSQTLFFAVSQHALLRVAQWLEITRSVTAASENYPRYSCLCGCCTFVLDKALASSRETLSRPCNCGTKQTTEVSGCPSKGCAELLSFVKAKYRQRWEHVSWGYFGKEQLFAGSGDFAWQRALANSRGPTQNSACCERAEKVQWGEGKRVLTWSLYQCKTCHVWTHATTEDGMKIAIVLNNPIRSSSINSSSEKNGRQVV